MGAALAVGLDACSPSPSLDARSPSPSPEARKVRIAISDLPVGVRVRVVSEGHPVEVLRTASGFGQEHGCGPPLTS